MLWVARAEPWGHSTWVKGSCCLPPHHPPFVRSLCHVWHLSHAQVIGAIHSLLKPPDPMQEERGCSAISLLRIFQIVTLSCPRSHYLTHGSGLWQFPILMTASGSLHHPTRVVSQLGKKMLCLNMRFLTAASTSHAPMFICPLFTTACRAFLKR